MVARRSESRSSFDRIAKRVGSIADALIGALTGYDDLLQVLERFKKVVKRTRRRDARSKPGTLELLRDPEKLRLFLKLMRMWPGGATPPAHGLDPAGIDFRPTPSNDK